MSFIWTLPIVSIIMNCRQLQARYNESKTGQFAFPFSKKSVLQIGVMTVIQFWQPSECWSSSYFQCSPQHYLNSQPPWHINLLSFFSASAKQFWSTNTRNRWSTNTRNHWSTNTKNRWSANTRNHDLQWKDDLHLIWYRLHSVAGAMFYHRLLVPQTVSSQANQKVIHCCCYLLLKMKHDKFVGYCKTRTIERRNSKYFTGLQQKDVSIS